MLIYTILASYVSCWYLQQWTGSYKNVFSGHHLCIHIDISSSTTQLPVTFKNYGSQIDLIRFSTYILQTICSPQRMLLKFTFNRGHIVKFSRLFISHNSLLKYSVKLNFNNLVDSPTSGHHGEICDLTICLSIALRNNRKLLLDFFVCFNVLQCYKEIVIKVIL